MNKLNPFKLEEYFTRYEFSAEHLLCCSDIQSFKMFKIVDMASPEDKKLWDNLSLGYTTTYGDLKLREAIATLYPGLSSENILCFAGAEEGIFCGLSVLTGTGDHAIVVTPCYQSLMEIPQSNGVEITEVELKEANDWKIDLNLIRNSIKANTKCIIINFPHNPTGQILDDNDLNELISMCKEKGIWIFSDEVYGLIGAKSTPSASLYDKALSLNVMSKSFGLPGLRIGWIACQDKEMLHKMKCMKDYLSICNSGPSEVLALIALRNKDAILARNNKIVSDNLALLDKFFVEYNHLFEWVRPTGGCVGFVKYKRPESTNSFCDRAVRTKNLLLMPGSVYGDYNSYFRIGFGKKNMPECLEIFKEFLSNENTES